MLCTGKQPNIIVSQFMHNHEIHLGILSPSLVLTKTNFKKTVIIYQQMLLVQ